MKLIFGFQSISPFSSFMKKYGLRLKSLNIIIFLGKQMIKSKWEYCICQFSGGILTLTVVIFCNLLWEVVAYQIYFALIWSFRQNGQTVLLWYIVLKMWLWNGKTTFIYLPVAWANSLRGLLYMRFPYKGLM